jgi:uncharacterized protein with PQ loop repeat
MEPMQIFGWLGIILVNVAYFPQIIKTIRLKHTNQISPLFYLSITMGIVSYEIYALWRNDPVFIASNLLGLIQPVLMTYLAIIWKDGVKK